MKAIFTLLLSLSLLFITQSAKAQTTVLFHTNVGAMVIELNDTLMPITVGNFLKLTNDGFYDGVIFHRVIFNFVIQTGDPTGTGSGGPGYTIQDEFDSTLSNIRGTLAMANTGQPNSGGSQFYFNLVDNSRLDFDKAPLTSKHPVFGFVLHNIHIMDSISRVATDGNDRPLVPVVIDSIRVLNAFVPTGLEDDPDAPFELMVYPNPISDESVLALSTQKAMPLQLSVFDPMGREVHSEKRLFSPGRHQVPIRDLLKNRPASGVYFVIVQGEGSVLKKRLIYTN